MSFGYRVLVCAILIQTYFDLKTKARKGGRNFQMRQEALGFLKTDWFETLCTAIDLDPSFVRKEMLRASANTRNRAPRIKT
ncbi:hypothetical protein EXW96_25300 [Paenibacillus sp. JMULE4]|uniref:hypothetical protein n=1 Tax=Paenibacillus sp. JMULE4 TaxID=2518342 RepID=UPI001575F855|nr:hypothetical protein [Paenibacillus sp. JMULE4]NTZ20709.1 hypothetical protein [Paenibacillus sp. JMULE4]